LGSKNGVASSKSRSKKLEDKSEKLWDLMRSTALNFICTAGDSVMIHFPTKRYLSVSTTCAIQLQDRGAEKFGSLKYFDVYGIHEKEPRINGWDLSSRSAWLSARNRKEKLKLYPVGVSAQAFRSILVFIRHLTGLRPLHNNFRIVHSAQVSIHHRRDRNESATSTMLKFSLQ
jgi:hypothetical protein